jgi:hypothetical protein
MVVRHRARGDVRGVDGVAVGGAMRPALTAEEWSDKSASYHEEDGPEFIQDKQILIGPSGESIFVKRSFNGAPVDMVSLRDDQLVALIALANHALPDDHPLKITREMIDGLIGEAEAAPTVQQHAFLISVASVLAALLPP